MTRPAHPVSPPSPERISPAGARRWIILGCGYVGEALARAVLAEGWSVDVLTRNAERAAALRALGANAVVADLADAAWHGELDPGDAVVVNTVSPAAASPAGYRHSFIEGTQSVARWLEKSAAAGRAPAREFIFTSATSVYPQTDGGWVVEDAPVDAAALSDAGAILREAETLVRAWPVAWVRRAWVLRLGGLYGPQRHHLLEALRRGQRDFPGDGGRWMNLLHRDDAVGAIRACAAAPAAASGGIFNAVDDQPVLKQDLLTGLARRLGLDAATVRCDAALPTTRGLHRQPAGGGDPHRRVANAGLKKAAGWKLLYPSFLAGTEKI